MISPRELRLYNFFKQPNGDLCFVTSIGLKVNGQFDYHEVHPIKLTEQWFVDFGFEKVKSNTEKKFIADFIKKPLTRYTDFNICYDPDDEVYYEYNIQEIMDHKIIYVHQLQNLYFMLTEEELTLKKHG